MSSKKFLAYFLLIFILVVSSFLFWLSSNRVTPILMFHDVAEVNIHGLNIISSKSFQRRMEFLFKHQYKVYTLDDLVEARSQNKDLPSKSVIITFDDGFEGVYKEAFPVLKKYNFSAIIFMPTGYIEKEGYLTIDQIKEMDESGLITFGSHTVAHEYLPELSEDRQKFEIVESKNRLEAILGKPVKYFSYPSGGFLESVKQMVREAGYTAAVTTNRGYDRLNRDFFELKRVSMRTGDMLQYFGIKFIAKSSGYYNVFRSAVAPHSKPYTEE